MIKIDHLKLFQTEHLSVSSAGYLTPTCKVNPTTQTAKCPEPHTRAGASLRECCHTCNVTAMQHCCELCGAPIPAVAMQAEVATYRTRARRGGWSHRGVICLDCVDDTRYRVVSADGLREAVYPFPGERADPVECQVCGQLVILRRSTRRKVRVCSDACRARSYATSVERPVTHCEGCGAPMQGRSDRRYCSPACRQRAYRGRVSAES